MTVVDAGSVTEEAAPVRNASDAACHADDALAVGLGAMAAELARVDLDGDRMAADLARLVLGLVAFLHRVLELQAIRHLDDGTLPEEELDRIGTALSRGDAAITEVAARFGLRREDLSLDLGPLGRTV
ncbi:MAG: gas vesicle protein K [Rhodobacteraceae bacterium]|jgi:hypothetical protein|nr:gas vesicle protein K [Paracoccaceae bacterium]